MLSSFLRLLKLPKVFNISFRSLPSGLCLGLGESIEKYKLWFDTPPPWLITVWRIAFGILLTFDKIYSIDFLSTNFSYPLSAAFKLSTYAWRCLV